MYICAMQTNLSRALWAYIQKYDTTSKAVAKEIGIGDSTLCRLKDGKLPDAVGLLKIMVWLVAESRGLSERVTP